MAPASTSCSIPANPPPVPPARPRPAPPPEPANPVPEMAADDVLDFLALMDASGIHVWLDGGWAVDACLGSQIRRHADLDIVVEERDAAAAVALLRDRGYGPVPGRGGPAWNFVLGDSLGHEVDLHVV